jgi:phosphoserine phosphatase RsbU/P
VKLKRQQMRKEILATSRILIVDDQASSRRMLHEFCVDAGFVHIAIAADGQEALDHVRAHKVDLMLLDMYMPQMNGLDLCSILAKEQRLEQMIIIMQTASDNAEIKAQAFEEGVNDLITKPLVARETMARVIAHLERRYLQHRTDEHYRRIQEELDEAMVLQNILLPHEDVIENIAKELQIDLAHYYHPARELAGDYIAIRRLDDERVALISVDISGHGLTAALYAFSAHTLIEDALLSAHGPAQTLTILNSKLNGFMRVGTFATAFIAIIHTKQCRIEYASAAAPPPLFLASQAPTLLNTRGQLLGVDAVAHYETHHLDYRAGDVLFIYSDALVESPNESGITMSNEDMASILKASTRDAGGHLRALLAQFYEQFTRQPEDDLSMIACVL